MIRFQININDIKAEDNSLFYKFCNNKLNEFKTKLAKNVNMTKFNLRYNYLVDNHILEFNSVILVNPIAIVNNLIQSFTLYKSINANGNMCISFNIPDSKYILNSNMTLEYFIRFIEYGNEEIPPYKWISHTWKDLMTNIVDEWTRFKKLSKKLEGIKV